MTVSASSRPPPVRLCASSASRYDAGCTRSSSAAVAARAGSGSRASASPARSMPSSHRRQPGRPLRMAASGRMQREHRVRGHEEHPRTVTQPGIAAGHPPTLPRDMTDETLRWRGGWARLGSWRGTRRRGLSLRGRRPPPDPRDRGPLPQAAARPRLLGGRHERARRRGRAAVPRRRVLRARTSTPPRPLDG